MSRAMRVEVECAATLTAAALKSFQPAANSGSECVYDKDARSKRLRLSLQVRIQPRHSRPQSTASMRTLSSKYTTAPQSTASISKYTTAPQSAEMPILAVYAMGRDL